ncbi:MAG: SIS domain-containing protein [Oligoflexia bacterium]|nr:SIS domain-containing protein [Oligoflexia bacterium]MBF0366296.1 SIS domain-containing protein [Oligoflexia bacterium]
MNNPKTTSLSSLPSFSSDYFQEVIRTANELIQASPVVEAVVSTLDDLRSRGGRLFFLGVGGSAGNCGHAVNDFRKLCGIETYAPTDNVSELTARTNDEGWDTIFIEWLKTSKFSSKDAIFVLSVGGGDLERNVSPNIVRAVMFAKEVGADILGIVGRADGFTAKSSEKVIVIPIVNDAHRTPHSESFQSVVLHLLVSHPTLKNKSTKWESLR